MAVRPQIRQKRRAEAIAAVAILLLGVMAVLAVRNFPRQQLAFPALNLRPLTPSFVRVKDVRISGVPDEIALKVSQAVGAAPADGWGVIDLYRAAKRVPDRVPCVRAVRFHWDFLHGAARLEAFLHKPAALVTRGGRGAGWIAESGVIVTDAKDIADGAAEEYARGAAGKEYSSSRGEALPTVELHGQNQTDYSALVHFIAAAAKPGVLPSPVLKIEFVSQDEQWRATLADGTVVRWGNLNWTEQKLTRLSQVLADASVKFGSGFSVDLRYFEFGKILAGPRAGVKL